MDPEQSRLQADLRGLLEGEVYCDQLFTQMYASDASVYEIQPLGVVRPRSSSDVAKLLRYCHENDLSVFPRGGGSGLAGQSLGHGIVVDFSRYMRRVSTPRDGIVRVQAGVVQADLNRSIGKHNLLFGPDPATRSVSSIGSMLSVDAAGSHFPRYGSTGDCVRSVQVVLATGDVVEFSQHVWARDDQATSIEASIAREVGMLLQQSSALLLRPPWGDIARGCGYRVEKVLDGDRVNLARLMCGSEGTLGIITEATLDVAPIPKVRGLLLLFFQRLDLAAKASVDVARDEVAACDLMDRRLLEIARETEPVYETIIPRGAEAMLLVEMQGEDPQVVRSRLMQLLQRLQRRGKPVLSYRLTTDSKERNLLWRLARRVIPRLYRLKGNQRPLPFIEDISIPPNRLAEFLRAVQDILKAERVTATVFAHVLSGQLDVRPFFDLASNRDQVRLAAVSEQIYEKVLEFEGCVSGHQAFGLSRAAWAERQLGPRLELCRKIKQVFDPEGILNPGKFLSPTPPKVNDSLRPVPDYKPRQSSFSAGKLSVVETPYKTEAASTTDTSSESQSTDGQLPVLLDWDEESLPYTARACNGCGRCRTSAAAERMCPVFRVHKGEEAAPRAKANLLRGVLTGSLETTDLESRELKAINDLCFNCHQCRIECPASVNIPKLVQEAKAQHVAGHGLPVRERLINRVDLLSAFGSRFPRFANWSLENRAMRWVLEKTFGIAQGRKLPRVVRRSFLRWAAREKLNRIDRSGGKKVVFFVDHYVNWHNPLLGRALVEVMRHQNVDVYIPTQQTSSWMSMIASGDVARARKLMQTNVKVLAEAVRQGYHIVTTEPSAALCLKEEYKSLQRSEETELIAENSSDVCSYLWSMHEKNELELDFKPVNMSIAYHQPCHSRVLDSRQPAMKLMQLIPGLHVENGNDGCSGMAGTFGLQRKNFRMSIRIGRAVLSRMKETSAQMGTTECTACKLQMEQATSKPTVHPIALLAYAYGKMPQLAGWFSSRNEGIVVS